MYLVFTKKRISILSVVIAVVVQALFSLRLDGVVSDIRNIYCMDYH